MNQTNNLDQARFNMVEQQIRPAEVLDPNVLNAIDSIPRETFIPSDYKGLAYSDTHIPIGSEQVTMTPIQEARMLQALGIQATDKILEIGTGCGYLTALLAHLGEHVTSVEIDASLSAAAQKNLTQKGIENITLETGDAAKGWPVGGTVTYDAIAVTGSMPVLDPNLKNQLAIGGRLCVVVGNAPIMQFMLVTRIAEQQWREECLFETLLTPLQNVQLPPEFVF
ncbi:MAG: protein-L-isoaspartate O-methyltransferase [Gammaproteobacteria bacterium]|nr:protein-L-isoaspartate O-methyltransferase [Gammaproteobacteria bacterium]MDH5801765.1 protein-L-isoaspartate O-methyltransferase [Gammaproteobacteria bacterium]